MQHPAIKLYRTEVAEDKVVNIQVVNKTLMLSLAGLLGDWYVFML